MLARPGAHDIIDQSDGGYFGGTALSYAAEKVRSANRVLSLGVALCREQSARVQQPGATYYV